MDLQLKGKRAVVTGASSGIGIEIAKLFAQEGVSVVVNGRNRERTEATVNEIKQAGGKAVAAVAEITTDEGCDIIAKAANDAFGGADILVNNAGGRDSTGVQIWNEITIEDYANSYNFNVLGGLRLVNRLVPGMIERKWGRVINVSSAIARQSMGMMHEYAAAKIAVENVSLNLSQNLAQHGVTVNTVVPGLMMTPTAKDYVNKLAIENKWPDAEKEQRYIAEFAPQAVHRLGKPVEIANAIVFLCSPLSDYTTNAILRVDGGMTKAF